jgi:Ribosomal protein L13
VNAKEAVFTGNKEEKKLYRWHTGWMGGLKTLTARQMRERAPDRLISIAVKGMLPNNKIRDERLKRLRIFADEDHSHDAQIRNSNSIAADYLKRFSPRVFTPAPSADTGVLVKNIVPLDEKGQKIPLDKLVMEDPNINLEKYKHLLPKN